MTWITDAKGNKCSVEYFGSKEAAQKALDSLEGCRDCVNCSGCYDCSGCSRCSRCSGCYDCYDCSHVACVYEKKDLKADESEDYGSPEVPVIPDIHKAVYAAVTAPQNKLEMKDWHICETTHCRGGWVVTLAGEQGKALEKFHGTLLAAQLIYDASDTRREFNPCRFFDSNDEALADMKHLAEM